MIMLMPMLILGRCDSWKRHEPRGRPIKSNDRDHDNDNDNANAKKIMIMIVALVWILIVRNIV
jgi:hypothetical protein